MTVLNRDAILAADDYQREYVDMPEWGGGVYVRALTAKAGLEMATQAEKVDEKYQAVARVGILLTRTVIDENGEPIFTDEDISALMEKSRPAIDRLTAAAMRVNKMGGYAEDAEKN